METCEVCGKPKPRVAKRLHFVEVADDSKTVCGVSVPPSSQCYGHLPLVFRDQNLWWHMRDLGQCSNCNAALAKRDREAAGQPPRETKR